MPNDNNHTALLPVHTTTTLQSKRQTHRRHLVPSELSFIQAVQSTYPAHYTLFNNELHFSNMLLADDRLKNRTIKVLFRVSDWITITVKYHVRPFLMRHMAKLYWLIRYKILLDNFRLHTYERAERQEEKTTTNTQ